MNLDRPVVFIVDDDYRVREALSSLISSAGLDVAAFGSAAEFLGSEKPDSPACLVLDLELPGTSGLELQRELIAGVAPPIIFITGHGDVPSSVRAMKAGAIEFLSKPFDDEELLQAIDAAPEIGTRGVAEALRPAHTARARSPPAGDCGLREQADCCGTRHERDHDRGSSWPDHAQDGRAITR
jgi:FixJ family two-component response regulator